MTRFKSRMGLRGLAWLTSHRAASVVGVRVEPRVQRAPGVNVIGAGSNVGCITAHDNARARARARSQRCTFAHTCLPAHSPKTRHTASHGLLLSQAKPSQAKPANANANANAKAALRFRVRIARSWRYGCGCSRLRLPVDDTDAQRVRFERDAERSRCSSHCSTYGLIDR